MAEEMRSWSDLTRMLAGGIASGDRFLVNDIDGVGVDADKYITYADLKTAILAGVSSAYGSLTGIPDAIDAIDGLTPAADKLAYYTGASAAALATLTAFARSLLDDADAATMRATLGLAAIASTGSYTDLADKPSLFSGAYSDLTGKPTLGTAAAQDSSAFAAASHTHAQSDVSGLTAALAAKVASSLIGVANGVASLDADGLIPAGQLPAIAVTDTFEVASQSEMLALVAGKGDVAIRTDENKCYILATNSPSTLADWKLMRTPTDLVLAVAGLTGTITASALKVALAMAIGDVSGLQTALDAKQGLNSNLTAIAGQTTAANKLSYWSGSGAASLTDLSSFIRTLLDDADAATVRATIGLDNVANVDQRNAGNLSSGTVDDARLSANVALNTQSSLAYAATTTIDLSGVQTRTLSLTGNVTFATSGRAAGRSVAIRITCDGTPRTFTFPGGWVFVGAAAPSGIAAGKVGILSITCFGTNDSDVIAAYAEQP